MKILSLTVCLIGVSFGLVTSLVAQQAFIELKQSVQTQGPVQAVYALRATQPLDSKLTGQKIQLSIDQSQPGGTSSHQLTINTGKYKTVKQMKEFVGEIFHRFLVTPATAGEDFGKIGDVRYGGEIHFVADSPDSLRYDITTPEGPSSGSGRFSHAEVEAFWPLVTGTPLK